MESATHKIVNGQVVNLSPQEAAAIEAEWKANEPKPPTEAEKLASVPMPMDLVPRLVEVVASLLSNKPVDKDSQGVIEKAAASIASAKKAH